MRKVLLPFFIFSWNEEESLSCISYMTFHTFTLAFLRRERTIILHIENYNMIFLIFRLLLKRKYS